MRRWRRRLKVLLVGTAAIAVAWFGGLAWFVHSSLAVSSDRSASTDAIVVLTGGRLRVETALDLLSAGRAQKLFISGVNPRVDRLELLRVDGWDSKDDSGRIDIGHEAENTLGNALETAEWMRQENYRSLRLVTSWYHMRRSLLEFERVMPNTRIIAEPVFSPHAEPATWSGWVDIALLTIGEYDKFLATLVRPQLAVFWPRAGQFPAQLTAGSNGAVADRRP
jgi:uncharacterized SAM-binding protein YcdF (DUF218 family)